MYNINTQSPLLYFLSLLYVWGKTGSFPPPVTCNIFPDILIMVLNNSRSSEWPRNPEAQTVWLASLYSMVAIDHRKLRQCDEFCGARTPSLDTTLWLSLLHSTFRSLRLQDPNKWLAIRYAIQYCPSDYLVKDAIRGWWRHWRSDATSEGTSRWFRAEDIWRKARGRWWWARVVVQELGGPTERQELAACTCFGERSAPGTIERMVGGWWEHRIDAPCTHAPWSSIDVMFLTCYPRITYGRQIDDADLTQRALDTHNAHYICHTYYKYKKFLWKTLDCQFSCKLPDGSHVQATTSQTG